jgi:hypothetical protein
MGRGNELCSYANKVQSHQKLHGTQPNTRPHELQLEYLKTRLGLSGLPLPLLTLNYGRRKGAYQNIMPRTLDLTLPIMVEQAIVQG